MSSPPGSEISESGGASRVLYPHRLFFDDAAYARIISAAEKFRPENIVYCSFENRFAKSGGLAAVAANLVPALARRPGVSRAILLSPFYPRLMNNSNLEPTGIEFEVKFGSDPVRVRLYSQNDSAGLPSGVREYFLRADYFFDSGGKTGDPYHYSDDPPGNHNELVNACLLFSKAVPEAIIALGLTENVGIMLQEWQTAPAAVFIRKAQAEERIGAAAVLLTMHNPYDMHITHGEYRRVFSDGEIERMHPPIGYEGASAWLLGMTAADGPITTVSETFARELISDPLQTAYFAPYMQYMFAAKGLVGINNGPFVKFNPDYPRRADHPIEEIAEIKMRARRSLLEVLARYHPDQAFGEIGWRGRPITDLPDDVPILVMSGRLDPLQKGFDILIRALERFARDRIKTVISPMPIRPADIDYFRGAAERCRGDLIVYPMRMQSGYNELQTGASFGVMPSVYEPFGAAIEFAAAGTPTIARATGGLIDQVSDGVNGFLYRESAGSAAIENIINFAAAGGEVRRRGHNEWVIGQVDALETAIGRAAVLYRGRRPKYYRMIRAGFARAENFSWDRSAGSYISALSEFKRSGN